MVFDHYIQQGIVPDIGAGYSSGIVSISACFGSVPDTYTYFDTREDMSSTAEDFIMNNAG